VHAHPRVRGRYLREDLRAVVGSGVVDGDDLEVGRPLVEDRCQAAPEETLFAMGDQHDAQPWHAPPLARRHDKQAGTLRFGLP
jgi:hypothetical protein